MYLITARNAHINEYFSNTIFNMLFRNPIDLLNKLCPSRNQNHMELIPIERIVEHLAPIT